MTSQNKTQRTDDLESEIRSLEQKYESAPNRHAAYDIWVVLDHLKAERTRANGEGSS